MIYMHTTSHVEATEITAAMFDDPDKAFAPFGIPIWNMTPAGPWLMLQNERTGMSSIGRIGDWIVQYTDGPTVIWPRLMFHKHFTVPVGLSS